MFTGIIFWIPGIATSSQGAEDLSTMLVTCPSRMVRRMAPFHELCDASSGFSNPSINRTFCTDGLDVGDGLGLGSGEGLCDGVGDDRGLGEMEGLGDGLTHRMVTVVAVDADTTGFWVVLWHPILIPVPSDGSCRVGSAARVCADSSSAAKVINLFIFRFPL